MDMDSENDYKRAIVDLKHRGYKLKKLKKVIKMMIEEEKDDDYIPIVPQSTTSTKQRADRLSLTARDIELINKWAGGAGFTAEVAANVKRQNWISPKQRLILEKDGSCSRNYHTTGRYQDVDFDYETDYEESGFYDIGPWGSD